MRPAHNAGDDLVDQGTSIASEPKEVEEVEVLGRALILGQVIFEPPD